MFITTPEQYASNNAAIADIFHRIAACYRYLGNYYKQMRTYDKAAAALHHLKEDISISLEKDACFTDDIRFEIKEFLDTGCIQRYQHFKRNVPVELLELLEVKGFGSGIVKALHEQLHIDNLEQLKAAVLAGKLKDVQGINPAKMEHLRRSLKLYKTTETRWFLWDAILRGNEILRVLRLLPGVENASFAGSLRRGCETIGDIDIVLEVEECNREEFLIEFMQLPHVENVAGSGWNRVCAVLYGNLQLDIRMTTAQSFGAALLYYTGVKEHISHLYNLAEQKGYTLTMEGLFDTATLSYLAGKTEESIYAKLNIQYIPPELREGENGVSQAYRHMLPDLLTHYQIRGDMRIYVNHHAGNSIESIIHYVINAFPHYEYMVVMEHSEFFHDGNNRDWLQNIDDANARLGLPFLKKGVSVELLPDGTLDLPDEFLKQFDWVTAVIHQDLDKDITSRLLKACENPLINCIGNPSNRIIGQRDPSIVNWQLLFDKAAATATALEINAMPYSLDLKDELVRKAVGKKVYFAISSCAESFLHCDYMQMGVTVARRGWCTPANVLNTMHWKDIEKFKHARESAITWELAGLCLINGKQ
ncbi:DNA polymerase (family 10) [Chitinophaga sp. CF118]|uniref:hypothetical protein n=1 Tax=Chitinophaga sp. CF118 TaxID=1884367 RepID=UPI0008E8FE7D|nr:hypothetical protein [Chitinophaga sp. CF118]SFD83268.1 DNA polymerase (family 10) [Chitinophaga sp. CF118]